MFIGEPRIWKIFTQLCESLNYIHSKNILHGDLKPQNVLLSGKDYDVKLADFGISTAVQGSNFKLFDAIGSLTYMSPELIKGEPYDTKADVWGLGCILYEMITKKPLFGGGSEEKIKQKITSFQIPQLTEAHCSMDLIQVYQKCMIRD